MQKNIKNISETEQLLEIILSPEEFGAEYKKEEEEVKRTIQLKGFRRGHAPAGLVKKIAGPSIETAVAEKMASKYFSEIVDAEKIKPIGRAQIADYAFADNQLTLKLVYEVHPTFELNDYSGYTFTKARYVITDDDVDREIKLILKSHGTLVAVDGAATDSDVVIGDVWRLDENGEPNEVTKSANHHFHLDLLPAEHPFRVGLTGQKAGDVVEIENKPANAEEQNSDEEAPKSYRFRVAISEVKRLELPELTDELVNEMSAQRFDTVADFVADIRLQLEQHFTMKAEEDFLESISVKLIDENPVPAPKSMIESFTNMLVENAKRQFGGTFPDSFDMVTFRKSLEPNAIKHTQWLLISQKIAEQANLDVTDEDIKAFAEKEASKNEAYEVEQLMQAYKSSEFHDYVVDTILKEKIYSAITAAVTVTEEERSIPVHQN